LKALPTTDVAKLHVKMAKKDGDCSWKRKRAIALAFITSSVSLGRTKKGHGAAFHPSVKTEKFHQVWRKLFKFDSIRNEKKKRKKAYVITHLYIPIQPGFLCQFLMLDPAKTCLKVERSGSV